MCTARRLVPTASTTASRMTLWMTRGWIVMDPAGVSRCVMLTSAARKMLRSAPSRRPCR